jgi:hypothetical protein
MRQHKRLAAGHMPYHLGKLPRRQVMIANMPPLIADLLSVPGDRYPAINLTPQKRRGSPTSRSTMVRARRDLPMPGSPEMSTVWPSRACAGSQRRMSSAISSSRPTSGVVAVPSASNRLSTALGRSAA